MTKIDNLGNDRIIELSTIRHAELRNLLAESVSEKKLLELLKKFKKYTGPWITHINDYEKPED